VTNYFGETMIPISEVKRVEQVNLALNIRPIVIHLNEPSRFGSKIIFDPSFDSLFSSEEPKALIELRELLKQSKKAEHESSR